MTDAGTIRITARTLDLARAAKPAAISDYVIEWAGGPVKSIRFRP